MAEIAVGATFNTTYTTPGRFRVAMDVVEKALDLTASFTLLCTCLPFRHVLTADPAALARCLDLAVSYEMGDIHRDINTLCIPHWGQHTLCVYPIGGSTHSVYTPLGTAHTLCVPHWGQHTLCVNPIGDSTHSVYIPLGTAHTLCISHWGQHTLCVYPFGDSTHSVYTPLGTAHTAVFSQHFPLLSGMTTSKLWL